MKDLNLPIIKRQSCTLEEFIKFWGGFYSYSKENLYDECIRKQSYGSKDIESLYVWKNGMVLSNTKQKSLNEKIIIKLNRVNALKQMPLMNLQVYNTEFRDVSFVWRVFLFHIIKPDDIPMYDQNVHRTYQYIHGLEYENISESIKENAKEMFYFSQYYPFIKKIEGMNLRQIDRGLFAFGQFIKNQTYAGFFD